MTVQTAAKTLLQKNLNWRRVVNKAKRTADWDQNDYKTYCYEDSLPQGASEQREQLMREWQDEVQRGLRADVYEGFANTDLDNGDLQAIFGVLPPHNQ